MNFVFLTPHNLTIGYVCQDCGMWIPTLTCASATCTHDRVLLPENLSPEELIAAKIATIKDAWDSVAGYFKRLSPALQALADVIRRDADFFRTQGVPARPVMRYRHSIHSGARARRRLR